MKMEFENSEKLCEYISEVSNNTALLYFSCGKDSIAAWIQMKRFFKNIIPLYLYMFPGLDFVENSLKYYEDFFGTHIYRLPHPSFYRILQNLVWQSPENVRAVDNIPFPKPSIEYDDINRVVKEDYNVPPSTYTGVGIRASDNLQRYTVVKKYGAVNVNRRQFYPIYDWNKQRLIDEIKKEKVKLPIDYEYWGRSFDGFDYRFLKKIYENHRNDYEKIKTMCPLIDSELLRYQWREKHLKEEKINE